MLQWLNGQVQWILEYTFEAVQKYLDKPCILHVRVFDILFFLETIAALKSLSFPFSSYTQAHVDYIEFETLKKLQKQKKNLLMTGWKLNKTLGQNLWNLFLTMLWLYSLYGSFFQPGCFIRCFPHHRYLELS